STSGDRHPFELSNRRSLRNVMQFTRSERGFRYALSCAGGVFSGNASITSSLHRQSVGSALELLTSSLNIRALLRWGIPLLVRLNSWWLVAAPVTGRTELGRCLWQRPHFLMTSWEWPARNDRTPTVC